MLVRLLGTAAGGGFPQWNCACANCRSVRSGEARCHARTQSCVAISADEKRWFLLNASPDLHAQIAAFAPLQPAPGCVRGSPIEGVLLTGADLDHTLGVILLREGRRLRLHAPAGVRAALTRGLNLATVMESYCGIEWLEPPAFPVPLPDSNGAPSGLRYAAIPVAGHPPRYSGDTGGEAATIAYYVEDECTGRSLIAAPGLAEMDDALLDRFASCDLLLIDGSFWSENELQRLGAGTASAAEMGHVPVGGSGGTLARIAPLPAVRKIYVHINNTNPMLMKDSPERAAVEQAGVEVGWDGLEIRL